MAEILGVVAGAAGLATACKELYKGIDVLRQSSQRLKDAPRELTSLTEELQFLTHLVQIMIPREQTIKDKHPTGALILQHCVASCQEVLSMLKELQMKYSETLTTSRRTKLSKLSAFRGWEEDVNTLRDKIVGVKQNLSLISGLGSNRDIQIDEILVVTQRNDHSLSIHEEEPKAPPQTSNSSWDTVDELPLSESQSIETFNTRYIRKRQENCLQRACSCCCHRESRVHGHFWTFRYTAVETFRKPCDYTMCTGTDYGIKMQLNLTPMGLLWATEVQVRAFVASGGMTLRPALHVSRVIPFGSAGFEIITKLFYEEFDTFALPKHNPDYETAKNDLLRLSRDDITFTHHAAPNGQNYLEIFLILGDGNWGDNRSGDFFRFMVFNLGLLTHANLPRLLELCLRMDPFAGGYSNAETLLNAGLDPTEAEQSGRRFGFGTHRLKNKLKPFCLTSPGFQGMTPLHEAVLLGKSDAIVSHWISRCSINDRNVYGQSPLHLAVGQPSQVALLIGAGYDVNGTDNEGFSPLDYAIESAYDAYSNLLEATIDILLAYGGTLNFKVIGHTACAPTVALCVLHTLQKLGAHHLARAVCRKVLPSALRSGKEELIRPPGLFGASIRERTVLDYLIKLRPSLFINHNSPDMPQKSLLESVASAEQLRILANHFDLGKHQNEFQRGGLTLLRPPCGWLDVDRFHSPLPEMMDAMLDLGANVNLLDCWGHTPLYHRLIDCREAILELGKGFFGYIQPVPQSLAAVALLLQRGADPSVRDKCRCSCSPNGCSPFPATSVVTCVQRPGGRFDFIFPLEAMLYIQMLHEYCGSLQARQALLLAIRKAKHEELGMTHVCCFRNGQDPSSLMHPQVMSSEDIDDILEEEVDFIQILDEEMAQFQHANLDTLVGSWFSQIKKCLQIWVVEATCTSQQGFPQIDRKPLFQTCSSSRSPVHEQRNVAEHFPKSLTENLSKAVFDCVVILDSLRSFAYSPDASSSDKADRSLWQVGGQKRLLELINILQIPEIAILEKLQSELVWRQRGFSELLRICDAQAVAERFMSWMR